MSFKGQHVAITGGGGNLGRMLGAAALARGARVSLVDCRFDAAADFSGTQLHRADLTDLADTRRVFGEIGEIDVLFNVAGGFAMGEPTHEIGDETWNRMFDLNVRTLRHALACVVPSMTARRAGKIVNVGAASARSGLAGMGAYCAAKAVVIRLTESLSHEVRGHGINVNCVLPGVLDTPENRAAMPDADSSKWVAPADLANVMCFLASEDARAIHGQALAVTHLS